MTANRYTPPTKNLYPRPVYRQTSDPTAQAMTVINTILVIVVLIGIAYFAHSLGAF